MTIIRSFLLLVLLALPVGFAQHLYLGATLGTPLTNEVDTLTDVAELGVQLGLDVVPNFGVRVSTEGNPFNGGLKLGSVDAIVRSYLPFSANTFYFGLGADIFYERQPQSPDELQTPTMLFAHALTGFELRLGHFGFFGELLPSYELGSDFTSRESYFLRARGGINFHF